MKFTKSLAEVKWGAVPGATGYLVTVSKAGYAGPWSPYKTSGTAINLSYESFPNRDGRGGGYRITVAAVAKKRISRAASKTYKVAIKGTTVKITSSSTSVQDKVVSKAKACLKDGKVAVVGASVTAGALAAATSWIPGVDVVTAGGAAAAIGAAGIGAYVGCALM